MNLQNAIIRDVTASLPLAGEPGRLFFSSDTHTISRDNGSSWDDVSSLPSVGVNAQTGTSYTVVSDDRAFLLTLSNASPVAVSLPQATGLFDVGFWLEVRNLGAGTVTITAATSLIDGAASLDLAQGESVRIISDGTDYQITALIRVTFPESINAQTGTSYTVLATDKTKLVTLSNGSAVAVTLAQATGAFGAGWFYDVKNLGAGAVTITPTISTIAGASTLVLATGDSARVVSDGTNYQVTDLVRFALVPTSRTISTTAPLTGGGDLSANRTLAISVFGASGGSHSTGAVPDPGSSAGTTKFLREDATFAIPAGSFSSPLTTKGDIHTYGSGDARQAVGSNDTVPVADSTKTNGWEWRALTAGQIPAIAESGVTGLVSDLALKAPLASPALTGTPTAPTPSTADNSTKVATTAYVQAQGYGTQPVKIVVSLVGMPDAGAEVFLFTETDPVSFLGNFSGSAGTVGVNPTATATYTVKKNGSSIGTIVVSTGGVVTFTTTSGAAQSLASGDRLTVVAPGSQDATLSGSAFTLRGTR